ncbi:unnamed protein product [Musa acuminata subsp. burmannicoides]
MNKFNKLKKLLKFLFTHSELYEDIGIRLPKDLTEFHFRIGIIFLLWAVANST